jgi:uncharacterized Fe-S cluster protein YjdI
MPKKYAGDGIDVFFEPRLCIHAARCVAGLPDVFNPQKRPWIQPMNATAGALADVISQCPTGALHYQRADGLAETPAADDVVKIVANGPLYVSGDVTVTLPDGSVVRHDTRLALCRCGDSKNKPYCDNSHLAAAWSSS